MCECYERISQRLLERELSDKPDLKNIKVELGGYVLVFRKGDNFIPTLPIVVTGIKTTKQGKEKIKTYRESMLATYCPFCGIRFEGGL